MLSQPVKSRQQSTHLKKFFAGGFIVFSDKQTLIHAVLTAFI